MIYQKMILIKKEIDIMGFLNRKREERSICMSFSLCKNHSEVSLELLVGRIDDRPAISIPPPRPPGVPQFTTTPSR